MKDKLEKEYENALELFGVGCGLWDSFHTNFSPSYFCKANRKSIIAEYLYWENFTELMRKYNLIYYWGIDTFLKEYKKAVYSCLKNLD